MLPRVLVLTLACLLLPGCHGYPVPVAGAPTLPITPANAEVPPIVGRVVFPARTLQATTTEVVDAATVSLIDTATNNTVATGVSAADGTFTVNFPSGRTPSTTTTYYLEASKGLLGNAPGADVVRLRTVMRYAAGWTSITNSTPNVGIVVDAATTALAVGAGVRDAAGTFDFASLIGAYDAGASAYTPVAGLSAPDFTAIGTLIANVLTDDKDPVRWISVQAGAGGAWYRTDRAFLEGRIYDENGDLVLEPVTVEFSDDTGFSTSVTTSTGAYGPVAIPAGAGLLASVTWSGPSRLVRLPFSSSAGPGASTFNFGTSADTSTLILGDGYHWGDAAYLPLHPEVRLLEGDVQASAEVVDLLLEFSTDLDATNQNRFEDAIRIYPASAASGATDFAVLAPHASARDPLGAEVLLGAGDPDALFQAELKTTPLGATPVAADAGRVREIDTPNVGAAKGPYLAGPFDLFVDVATPLRVTFEDARHARISFPAPLRRSKNNSALYQVALVTPGGAQAIVDVNGRALGTTSAEGGATPAFGAYAGGAKQLIFHAFHPNTELNPIVHRNGTTEFGAARLFSYTHANAARFYVEQDTTAPRLVGVSVTDVAGQDHIALTFSEPMAAYGGHPNRVFENVIGAIAALGGGGLHVALAASEAALPADLATADGASGTAFAAMAAGQVYALDDANVDVTIDWMDPKVVLVTPKGAADAFGGALSHVRVRVGGVTMDPAENPVDAAQNLATAAR